MNVDDEILSKYEIRKSNKQKTEFIDYIKNRLEPLGYKVDIEETGFGIFKSRNIIVGDSEKADVLMGAHYDTCAICPFPNMMTPTSRIGFWGFQVLMTIGLLGVSALASMVAAFITENYVISSATSTIVMLLLLVQMMIGFENKHNANDNTSGIITLTHILEKLDIEHRDKICIIYFDNEEKGLFGSSFFSNKHKKETKNKLLINFDCVGDGDNIISIADKKVRSNETYIKFVATLREVSEKESYDIIYRDEKLKFMQFPSDQMNFKMGVGVCALRKGKLCLYADKIHTPKDQVCRKENIEYLTSAVVKFLNKLD